MQNFYEVLNSGVNTLLFSQSLGTSASSYDFLENLFDADGNIYVNYTIEKIDEKFYDDSVGRKTGESSNFHILKNSKGEAIIGKNFKKDDVNFMYGPALESRGRSWLTDDPFVQYTTIIWLPSALTPRHGIAIPLEEVIKAIEMDDEMLKEKLASIGLPVSLDEYNKQVLEFSK
jgi:hypothetical protein